jgi:hypothetical protein
MDPSQRSLDEPRKPAWIERIASYRRHQIATAHHATSEILPSFFIVGPPRTGTTWLHEILRWHTVLPYPTKRDTLL